MQSQSTFPSGARTSSARWPMAKLGSQPMPTRPGPSSRMSARWSRRSSSSVVHRWPSQPTYWRSSSQTGQRGGGSSLSANWLPQVTQMKFGTRRYERRNGISRRRRRRRRSLRSRSSRLHCSSSSIRAWSSFLNSRDSACRRARLSDESLIGIFSLHQKLDPVQLRLDPHQRLEDGRGVVEIRLPSAFAKHRGIVPEPPLTRKTAETD